MIFGLKIILLLLLISGSIAFIGDYLGRRIGKERLSLFGLRPLYTAILIAIISGMLIALTTLGTMLLISRNARTALFGLEELRKSITSAKSELEERNKELAIKRREQEELEKKLSSAKAEIQKLIETKEKLSEEIELTRKGKMLFRVNDSISISLIQAGENKEKIEAQLKQVLTSADSLVRSLGITSDEHLIFISPEEFNSTISYLQGKTGEHVVILKAAQNTLLGEEVKTHFEIKENKLIYKTGKEITSADIDGLLSLAKIEQEIKRVLSAAHRSARTSGVIPDIAGSLGSISYSSIFNLAKKIKSYNKKVNLSILAKEDIYAIGPLEVEFKIYYK